MKEVFLTSKKERDNLTFLETVDGFLFALRNQIRGGKRIEENLENELLGSISHGRENDE